MENCIYLINTTFLDKISHSSHDLRVDNIRGSILGSNIRKDIEETGMQNIPANFNDLFSYHQGFSWQENLERLVESTNNIKPNKEKVKLDKGATALLFQAPARAISFVKSKDYQILLDDLRQRCNDVKDAILVASHIENVNIRGRLIEVLITADHTERQQLLKNIGDIERQLPSYDTRNDLGDYVRSFEEADTYTDIKTKVMYLDSNPKAYNVDKFLQCMSHEKSVFMFFFVGVDETGIVNTVLASVFHNKLRETTMLQQHWAGRGTRGTAQFSGKTINELLSADSFSNEIDEKKAIEFLKRLLNR